MEEFETQVERQHGDSIHGQNYKAAIEYLKGVAGRIHA
jgi:hypothetical protein